MRSPTANDKESETRDSLSVEPQAERIDRWLWVPAAFAISSFIAATLAAIAVTPSSGQSRGLGFYWLAVIFVSWISGWRWGVFTMFGGAIASALFFTPWLTPEGSWSAQAMSRHWWYFVLSIPFAAGLGSIRHMRAKAARATALAKDRQLELERAAEARREAEDAVRETTDRMLNLLDRIGESMVAFDSDWRITYFNEKAKTTLGVGHDWLGSEAPWSQFPGGAGLRDRLQEAWKTGLPSRFELSDSGTGRWIEYRVYPTPEGMTLFAYDVSEQRRARSALEASEERYRAFISQSTEAIWRFELKKPMPISLTEDEQLAWVYEYGFLAECNDTMARQYGYESADQIVGARLNDLLPKDDPRNREYLKAFIRSGYRMDAAESYERGTAGNPKVFVNNLLGIIDDGHLCRAWGTQRDITDQKRQEHEIRTMNVELERRVQERTRELQQANSELEAFSYSVSHDLRAPLRSMMAQSMLLQEDYGDKLDQGGLDTLKRLATAAKNMAQLIDDLLALSRIQRAEINKEPVNLSEIASSVAQDLGNRGTCAGVDIAIQPEMRAFADPRLARVLLTNLLENACKFSSKSSKPCVEVGQTQEGAFFVRDNGVGFDMQYVHKVFLPFERLHRVEEYPGTGIGLANVARVVERHGGKVWAESEVSKGATFYFTLSDASRTPTESAISPERAAGITLS